MRNTTLLVVGLAFLAARPAAGEIRTFTTLLPPNPRPVGVAANGHGVAEIRLEPGIRERFKINVEDVAVIADPADPAFCLGFYEAVLIVNGAEVPLPAFPGFVVFCRIAGDPRGPTFGERDFDARLKLGQRAINPRGGTLQIWRVEPVRDPVTGAVVPGPNGAPFIIDRRLLVALQGVLQ